jgi:hypothetical protein
MPLSCRSRGSSVRRFHRRETAHPQNCYHAGILCLAAAGLLRNHIEWCWLCVTFLRLWAENLEQRGWRGYAKRLNTWPSRKRHKQPDSQLNLWVATAAFVRRCRVRGTPKNDQCDEDGGATAQSWQMKQAVEGET